MSDNGGGISERRDGRGLPFCKLIMQEHAKEYKVEDCTFLLESTVIGKGTTFSFTLKKTNE